MKKLRLLCFLILMVVSLSACSQAQINSIPSGYTTCDEHWDKNGFQDHTDYCKYTYPSIEEFSQASDYSKIVENDVEKICVYFDNFKEWMETESRLDEYDFQKEYINAGDYVKIVEKGNLYDNYTVCFFDVETLTLYFVHTNI